MESQSLTSMLKSNPAGAINEMVKASLSAMSERQAMWDRYWRKYRRGLRYQPTQDASSTPLFFVNYIFNVVEAGRVYLTRSLPSIVAVPVEVSDDVASQVVTTILKHELNSVKLMSTAKRVLQHAFITGLGWFKVYYDPDAKEGKGSIVIDCVPPEDILIDPIATGPEDARWVIHRKRNIPIELAASMFDLDVEDIESDEIRPLRQEGEHHSTPGTVTTLYEAWVMDYEKRKWRVLTLVGSKVVKDIISPYKHGKAPFVPLFDMMDDRADNFYKIGIGEVEEIEPQQDKADAMDYLIYRNIRQIVNRQVVVDGTKIDPSTVDNSPNRIYSCIGDPRTAIFWSAPPALSQDVFAYRYQIETYIQTVSGMWDVTQGKRPAGIVAARAIEHLQEAAATRLYDKQVALCDALKSVSEMALSIIFQFYEGERVIRIADNQYLRIVDRYPEALRNEPPEVKDQWKQSNGYSIVLEDIDLDYDIEVDAESSLPSARRDRAALAVELFRLGGIDRKALLETFDWPGRHEILARLESTTTGPEAKGMGEALGQMVEQLAFNQALPQNGMQ